VRRGGVGGVDDWNSEMTEEAIRFVAQVAKVTTLADGGIRLVLDLAESEIEVAKQMMDVRRRGALLEVAAIAVTEKIEKDYGI
jgi:hypothetical protein